MVVFTTAVLCRLAAIPVTLSPRATLLLLTPAGIGLMAGWPTQADLSNWQLPPGLARLRQIAQSGRIYAYKCLLLAWRLLLDAVMSTTTPVPVAGSRTLFAAPARCWDMWDLSRFDHQVFPKTTSPIETVFYLLRIKLLGGTSLFIIRDRQQQNRLVATLYLRQLPDSTVGFISNVGVHPDYRRQKLAKWMMQTLALPLAKHMSLTRLVLNVREPFVESFYERQGFYRYRGNAFEIETPEGETPMFMTLEAK
jgi:ribosomal protein S18 acetylase RimI-like enzyme